MWPFRKKQQAPLDPKQWALEELDRINQVQQDEEKAPKPQAPGLFGGAKPAPKQTFDPKQWALEELGRINEQQFSVSTPQPPRTANIDFIREARGEGELHFGGFEARTAYDKTPFWERFIQGATTALAALDPLLFAGDVAKAYIYGRAVGGHAKGLELAQEQLSRWKQYLPFGETPKPVISGAELAKLFVEAGGGSWDQLPAWKRLGLSFGAEVLTDPLAVFGMAGTALKAAGLGTRAVGAALKGLGVQPLATAAETALSAGAEAAFAAERVANLALNPYAQAFRAVKAGLNVRLNEDGLRVADTLADLWNSVMSTPIANRYAPKFIPRTIGEVIPGWRGSPETGPGIFARARAGANDIGYLAMRKAEELYQFKLEALGQETSFFGIKRRVIPPELKPLALEIDAATHQLLDNFGIHDDMRALSKFEGGIRKVAESVGFDPNDAAMVFKNYYLKARNAFLELQSAMTGFESYKNTFTSLAKNMGLDPEEAWKTYTVYRTRGFAVDVEKGVPKVLGPGPMPEEIPTLVDFGLDLKVKVNPTSIIPKVLERPDSNMSVVIASLLPPSHLPSLTQNAAFADKLERWTQAAARIAKDRQAAALSYETMIKDYIKAWDEVQDARLPRMDPAALEARTSSILKDIKNGRYDSALDEVARLAEEIPGIDLRDLLISPSRDKRMLGHLLFAAKSPNEEIALLALGKAAATTKKEKFQAFLYGVGAVPVHHDVNRVPKVSRAVGGDELIAVLQDPAITLDGVSALAEAYHKVPRNALLSYAQEAGDTPLANLARMLAEGDRKGALDWLIDAVTGKYELGEGGVDAIKALAKRIGGEDWLGRVILGKADASPEEVRKALSRNLDVLKRIETLAIKEHVRTHPGWGGYRKAQDFLFPPGTPKEYINPFSPLSVFTQISEGYARRLYLGVVSPQAAEAALLKGAITLIPEVNPEATLNSLKQYLKEAGVKGDIDAAIKDLGEYIEATKGRFVYSTETIAAILRRHVDIDQATWVGLLDALYGDSRRLQVDVTEALRRKAGEQAGRVGQPAVPPAKYFDVREENTELLLQMYDVQAAVTEFGKAASRSVFQSRLLEYAYRSLSDAGYLYERMPTKPNGVPLPGFVQVPDDAITIAGRQAYTYGPLAGKWIPEKALRDLQIALSVDPMAQGPVAAFLSFWRKSILNNPKTAVVNIIGNLYMTWAYDPRLAIEALGEYPRAVRLLNNYLDGKGLPDELQGVIYFLHETTLSQEVRNLVGEAFKRISQENPELYRQGWLERLIRGADKWTNEITDRLADALGLARSSPVRQMLPLHLFAYAENVQRLANYLAGLKIYGDRNRALYAAAVATGDYSSLPHFISMVRRTGLMAFPSFAYIIASKGAQWAVERPVALTLPQRFAQASWYGVPDSEADHMALMVYMADWLRATIPTVLPIARKEEGGKRYYLIPAAYVVPLLTISSSYLEEITNLGVWGPLFNALSAIVNYDSGREGRPILGAQYGDVLYPPLSSFGQAVGGTAEYLARKILPKYLTDFLGVLDLPDILALIANGDGPEGARQVLEVKGAVGKLVLQYTHPAAVKAAEERLKKQFGYTLPEFGVSMISTPRPVSTNPLGVGSAAKTMALEAKEGQLQALALDLAMRGTPIEEIQRRLEPELRKLRGEMDARQEYFRRLYNIEGITGGGNGR